MRLPSPSSAPPTCLHSSSASVLSGFCLHCASRASAHDQAARLRLLRYILRPAIAASSLAFDGTRVTFTMKRTLNDGRSVLHFSPQAFIRRIAQLVPRPRQHEIVYCGLFAPNAKDRAKVVRVATHRKRSKKDPKHDATTPSSTMTWSELLRRTFSHDLLRCERCGGSARVIAAITQRDVIDKILHHTGLGRPSANPASARAPARAALPARPSAFPKRYAGLRLSLCRGPPAPVSHKRAKRRRTCSQKPRSWPDNNADSPCPALTAAIRLNRWRQK